jgi:hypothetical protein
MTRMTRTAAAVFLFVAATAAAHQVRDAATTEFLQRLDAYLELRRQATRHAPTPHVTADPVELLAVQDAIADAIRAARPLAAAGDIFAAGVGQAFRESIERALRRHDRDVARLLAEHAPRVPVGLAVNTRFDWQSGSQMPSWMIAVLPPTPSDILQYRLVGRDLVLLDIGAGLIIDVLRDALPES